MELVNWKGIPLMVERAENQYKVIRIMSTDPVHYLDESIAPGQFISM
ncbi:hypothetical protein QY97_01161 [Bacillus thermotolerans]|nr:hypothetical protein QY97_01161 [Bacillus thermotolerans]KKB44724.1 hypothetical protein QY96_01682 [Bacillus thermotolerans]